MTKRSAFVVVLAVLALAGCSSSGDRDSRVAGSSPPEAAGMGDSAGGCGELSKSMRHLWAEHVVWTRIYIIAAIADQPDAGAASGRLLANQQQIGKAIAPYYGEEAGAKLASLLKDHILVAVDVVKAARAGDQAGLKDADRRWHDNAAELATFLSTANPGWPRGDLLSMLNEHLELTTREATARLKKDWEDDVRTFDRIFAQAMMMADTLTEGIVKQFPDRFRS